MKITFCVNYVIFDEKLYLSKVYCCFKIWFLILELNDILANFKKNILLAFLIKVNDLQGEKKICNFNRINHFTLRSLWNILNTICQKLLIETSTYILFLLLFLWIGVKNCSPKCKKFKTSSLVIWKAEKKYDAINFLKSVCRQTIFVAVE